ncbi:MAG: single-stranded-DNA-specific exonuclease RecJ [bacterium]|nr:single-stranded-DNA-specific exonuclease RecJ [bacterium]
MARIWKEKSNSQGDLTTVLLANREIEADGVLDFFDPKYEHAHDPFKLTDMAVAVERIHKANKNNERICVYADYDADAVTAAAVLLRFFKAAGFENIDYYIPDRFSEGYGMNSEAIAALASRGVNLIVTVDCGINALEAIDTANAAGMEVIVTDHHQLIGLLPRAVAVVNPHRPGDLYPFKDLTGVGVAFKLVQALVTSLQSSPDEGRMAEGQEGSNKGNNPSLVLPSTGERTMKIPFGFEKWLLDLVAIGTIADCMSLLGENRMMVKWGFFVMQKTRWVGLRRLMQIAGLLGTDIDTYHVGFIIAPRLNAAGRIEHASLALELLLTDDEEKAETLATKLNELNRHRQDLTNQILSEAREQLAALHHQKILLAAGDGWPKGVVGLVAGKLTEEFSRPVLILEKSGDHATGSARSIRNFNIVEAISKSESILVKYGGHPMAAGFSIRSEHIEVFHKNLLEYAETILTEEDLSPVLEYDTEVMLEQINDEMVVTLEKFAPFGLGNPRPRLRINHLTPRYISQIGKEGKHLRMYVSSGSGGSLGCIGFSFGFWAGKLNEQSLIDLICEPQFNEWNGTRKIQLKIIDIDFSTSPALGAPSPGLERQGERSSLDKLNG